MNRADAEKKVRFYLGRIIIEAEFLAELTGVKEPVVFISSDLIDFLKRNFEDSMSRLFGENPIEEKMICGYQYRIVDGENVLSVGYDIGSKEKGGEE